MDVTKKIVSLTMSMLIAFGVTSFPVFADTGQLNAYNDIGHMIVHSDNTTEYYVDGILQRQRSVTTTHGEMSIEHDSEKQYLNENFRGYAWTDMWYTERPFRYPRHYTRVKAYSGNGTVSDSDRKWVEAGVKKSEADTKYIYTTVTHRIESWWGYIDD